MRASKKQRGFTLIEIAIGLLVLAILLGYTVALFPVQQELKQYRHADAEMEEIIDAIISFAQINGRLPCPDTDAGPLTADGLEDTTAGPVSCAAFFGFVPARTLGLNGNYAPDGTLLDPWGVGYGYAVSDINNGQPAPNDDRILVTANGIRDFGITNVQPDLFVCDDSATTGVDLDCTAVTGDEILGSNGEVAAVIISLGKDNEIPATSNVQAENLDDFDNGTNDKVFVFAARGDNFDDIVKWIPTNLLISKMIEADRLP